MEHHQAKPIQIHQYQNTGVYNVSLISTSLLACNFSDTITKLSSMFYQVHQTLQKILSSVNIIMLKLDFHQ